MDIQLLTKSVDEITDVKNYIVHLIETYPNLDETTLKKYLVEYASMMNIKVKETA